MKSSIVAIMAVAMFAMLGGMTTQSHGVAAWDLGWADATATSASTSSAFRVSSVDTTDAYSTAASAPSLTTGEAWLWAFQYIFLIGIGGAVGWLVWQQQENTKQLDRIAKRLGVGHGGSSCSHRKAHRH